MGYVPGMCEGVEEAVHPLGKEGWGEAQKSCLEGGLLEN